MKFSVGYNVSNSDELIKSIINNREYIYEVYFSIFDFPNGRNMPLYDNPFEMHKNHEKQMEHIQLLSENNIKLNLLLNGTCYGKDSQSRTFFNKIGNVIDYLKIKYNLASVTTTSPLIAKFIKNNFEDIEVRASVNMEIGTVPAMEYVADYFDSYYMKREYNRDFAKIAELKKWCDKNGKKLFMLANSGCLNFCSAHNFHDNLVSHESEIAKMDNAYNFSGICHEFLNDERNYTKLIEYTNFVRPEDIYKYEGMFDAVKLATRVHNNPQIVLESYIKQKYVGDILRLLEPAHSIYPYVLENGTPLKLVKLETNIPIK